MNNIEKNKIGGVQRDYVHVIGQMDNTIDHTFESANRIYDINGLCPTIPTCAGGNIQPKVLVKRCYVSMRGRAIENKTSENGSVWIQQLEINESDICNSITSVQKDNLVLEVREKDEKN